MIDIHSHFLYGIDDGAKDFSQTQNMIQQAVEVGITDLIATPHFNEFISSEYLENINNRFNEINNYILESKIDLQIHLGSEILLDSKLLSWQEDRNFLIGTNKDYLLFELPHFIKSDEISNIIFELKLNKITPILAHPERSIEIQESPEQLIKWINQGCIMQMNAGSLLGQFGKRCESFAKKLLDSGVIHLFASDAHEPKHRNYEIVKEAKKYISENYDERFAEILFIENPMNILHSKPVKIFKTFTENLKNNKIKIFFNKLKLNIKS